MWFNDFVRALAELIRAAAWPLVVLFLLYRYRDRLGELIPRLRELFGAKFDPPVPVLQASSERGSPVEQLQAITPGGDAPPVPAANAAGDAVPWFIEAVRSPTVIEAEQFILNTPEIRALGDSRTRERVLSTLAAAFLVISGFEQIEAEIWGSQIYLLQGLNGAPHGFARELLKTSYYDVAAVRFPAWFVNYSFEQYLDFLSSYGLVADTPSVTITEKGRQYLMWRLRQRKPMKPTG